MTTALDCTIAAARSHVGVNEYPPKSNCQPFSAGLHRPCEAWCADGVCYCDHVDCNLDFAWLGLGPMGTPSCRVITVAAQRVGRFGPAPRRGCWVLFGAGGGSHIERVMAVVQGASGPVGIDTVGFNTSAPNNYAGGTVAAHRRMFGPGDDIYGYVYPPYTDEQPAPPAEENDVPFIIKCTDPKHSTGQFIAVGPYIVQIHDEAELGVLQKLYETHPLPSFAFDAVLKKAGALP